MATTKIRKEDVQLPKEFKDCLALIQDHLQLDALLNVHAAYECQEYINISEDKGYKAALVNIGGNRQELMTDVRNNSRCIWDTFEEVDKIWKRIQPFVPDVWSDRKVIGLNERLRILRYDPGEYFKPHYDGCYRRENGERSYVTIQIYLNEGFEGGSTTFLGTLPDERVEVVPKTGSVLIFEHPILHEGSKLISGRKYAIRTDVMYSSKVIQSQKDNESRTKEVASKDIQNQLEELEEERCKQR